MSRKSCTHLTFTLMFGKSYGGGYLVCNCCGKLASEIFQSKKAT